MRIGTQHYKELIIRRTYQKVLKDHRRQKRFLSLLQDSLRETPTQLHLQCELFTFRYYHLANEGFSIAQNLCMGHTYLNYTSLYTAYRRRINLDNQNYIIEQSRTMVKALRRKRKVPTPLFLDLTAMHLDLFKESGELSFYQYAQAALQVDLSGSGICLADNRHHGLPNVRWGRGDEVLTIAGFQNCFEVSYAVGFKSIVYKKVYRSTGQEPIQRKR